MWPLICPGMMWNNWKRDFSGVAIRGEWIILWCEVIVICQQGVFKQEIYNIFFGGNWKALAEKIPKTEQFRSGGKVKVFPTRASKRTQRSEKKKKKYGFGEFTRRPSGRLRVLCKWKRNAAKWIFWIYGPKRSRLCVSACARIHMVAMLMLMRLSLVRAEWFTVKSLIADHTLYSNKVCQLKQFPIEWVVGYCGRECGEEVIRNEEKLHGARDATVHNRD